MTPPIKTRIEELKKANNKKVELSLIQLSVKHHSLKPIFKVTRRFLIEGVQDTKLFDDLKLAKKQLKDWE